MRKCPGCGRVVGEPCHTCLMPTVMKQLHEYPTPITDIAAIWYAAEFDAGGAYDIPPGVHVAQARDMERRLGMCMEAMDSACAMLASAHMTTDARDVAMRVGDALRVATAAANWTPSGRPEVKECPRCGRVVTAPYHTCMTTLRAGARALADRIEAMRREPLAARSIAEVIEEAMRDAIADHSGHRETTQSSNE